MKTAKMAGKKVEKSISTATSPAVRTEEEWRRFIDQVVDEANRGLRRGGLEHEAVADLLFRSLFEGDVESGLDPQAHANEAFRRLFERAGASLRMQPAEFVTYVRVGAMNQVRRDGAWLDLDWSKKTLLVPLLSRPNGRELIGDGIAFAGQPNVGVRHLRDWVQEHVAKALGTVGRPRGGTFSLANGAKFAKLGAHLTSAKERRRYARLLAKAPLEKRREARKALREAYEGLGALLHELERI